MCTKRGQVTIFMIVGIILLFVAVGIFFITSQFTKDFVEEVPDQFSEKGKIQLFVQSCLEDITEQGIEVLSLQGGYYKIDKGLNTENLNVAYGYYDKQQLLTKEVFSSELSNYIEDNIQYCIRDFKIFEEFTVNTLSPEQATVDLTKNSVQVNLDYSLEIVKGNDKERISKFTTTIETNLPHAIETFIEIAKDIDNIPISKEPFISILSYDQYDHIISLEYKDDFFFASAIRLEQINHPPELQFIPDQVAKQGLGFYLETEATDPEEMGLIFSSNNPNIPIAKDGVFSFIPKKKGTFNIKITVEDNVGNKDSQTVRFVIE